MSLATIQQIGQQLETIPADVPAPPRSFRARRRRTLHQVDINRERAARFGLNIADAAGGGHRGRRHGHHPHRGGRNATRSISATRNPTGIPEQLALLPVITPAGQRIALGTWHLSISRMARPASRAKMPGSTAGPYVDIEGVDVGSYVANARAEVAQRLTCHRAIRWYGRGSTSTWSGPGAPLPTWCRSPWPLSSCCCT